ncbi:MAG: HAMP domain-containing histidine kinase, partial [Oscillospiraceae bacterium]|nr:HAMP domain-containing histidine kinase [Oscillospiraceae bacterium]
EFASRFSAENSNLEYAVYDVKGEKLVMGNAGVSSSAARHSQPCTLGITSASSTLSLSFDKLQDASEYLRELRNDTEMMVMGPEFQSTPNGAVLLNAVICPKYEFLVCLNLRQGLPVVDKYQRTTRFVTLLARYRFPVLAIAVFSLTVLIVLFILLILGTGRRPNSLAINLYPWDEIPLELYTVMMVGLVVLPNLLISAIEDIRQAYDSDKIFRMAVIILILAYRIVIIYSAIMSAARRSKAGVFLKNSLVNRLLHFYSNRLSQTEWGMRFYVRIVCGYLLLSVVELIYIVSLPWKIVLVIWGIVKLGACLILAVIVSNLGVLEAEGEALQSGNVSQKVQTERLLPMFRRHGESLNGISQGLKKTVEEQMKSERMKAELIANVSHDLKTPLTSIVNYVDLIKKAGLTSPVTPGYLAVLDRQAEKLKKLVLDLVEASKATSGNVTVEAEPLDLNLMLNQAAGEYAERMAAYPLEQIVELPSTPLVIYADPQHMWRVIDNLLGNALKYSQEGSRVYITAEEQEGKAIVAFRNISKFRLNISAEELMERFVRGDSSRHTEGSGLGLSIARGLTESQGGVFRLVIDGDLFKAVLEFPVYTGDPASESDEETEETVDLPSE